MKETCTKSFITLEYNKKDYSFIYNWGERYPIDAAYFMFREGNYSCDCNKSIFLKKYCSLNIKELQCGELIKLKKIDHEKT